MKNIIALLIGFGVTLALSPWIYFFAKKLKAGQTILHYVKEHQSKQGTPTFGGLIFVVGLVIISVVFLTKNSTLAIVTLATTLSFGLLGFLDDFIKIKYKQNLGLKAYQKFVGQLGISVLMGFFVFWFVGTELFVPFTWTTINLGWWIVPFVAFVFLSLVNSVNLLDGLDGLAGGVSAVFLIGIGAFMVLFFNQISPTNIAELDNLLVVCFVMIGCLVAYLCYNTYPAKIFMGDTGSLALGGFLTCICVFSRLTLYIPIVGFMFVLTALSDILQVGYFKLKRKRFFKMAPLHHHFQMSGVHENKIVFYYVLITCLLGIVNILVMSGL